MIGKPSSHPGINEQRMGKGAITHESLRFLCWLRKLLDVPPCLLVNFHVINVARRLQWILRRT
jgi:hypothetical protein